ncbi:hypothetical protein ACFS07_34890 [Undibacterium arcticum]
MKWVELKVTRNSSKEKVPLQWSKLKNVQVDEIAGTRDQFAGKKFRSPMA